MRLKIFWLLISLFLLTCCSSTLEPVGGSTSLQYSVPKESHIKIIILNSYDTIVATLVNKVQAAGLYKIAFTYSDYNMVEGVYFYKFYVDYNLFSTKALITGNQ